MKTKCLNMHLACLWRSLWLLLKYCIYCVLVQSLHRESTDSLITNELSAWRKCAKYTTETKVWNLLLWQWITAGIVYSAGCLRGVFPAERHLKAKGQVCRLWVMWLWTNQLGEWCRGWCHGAPHSQWSPQELPTAHALQQLGPLQFTADKSPSHPGTDR